MWPLRRGILTNAAVSAAGAPPMPAGLIGYWNTDSYNSTAKTITNEIDGTAPPQNQMRLPYTFAGSTIWGTASATLTADYAAAPDGVAKATRVVGTGAFWTVKRDLTSVAAGTYTLAVYVKSNTGVSQNFRMWLGSAGLTSKTATTSWQRFTVTGSLTSGAQTIYPVFSDGTNDCDILIAGAELYAGSSDLGPAIPKGHLYLGKSAFVAPAVTSGFVAAGGLGGIVDFISDQTLSTFTAFACAKKTASAETHQAFLSNNP